MRGPEPVTEQRELRCTPTSTCSRRIDLVELVNDEDSRVAPAVREARSARSQPRSTAIVERVAARWPAGLHRRRHIRAARARRRRRVRPDVRSFRPTGGSWQSSRAARAPTQWLRRRLKTTASKERSDIAAAQVGRTDAVVALSASGEHALRVGAARAASRGRRPDGRAWCAPATPSSACSPTTRSSRSSGPR